jgi:hypothetical protein
LSVLGAALGLALLAFFLWKSLSKRIYLLGLPFLMFMGESIFFDRVKIFWMPQRLGASTMIMVWLIIVWVLSMDFVLPRSERRVARRPFGPPPRLPEELLLAVLGALIVAEVVVSAVRYGDLPAVIGQASGWIYLLVGYLLVRGMVAMAEPGDVIEFLDALVVVNAGAAVLYVAFQALHLPIYEGSVSRLVVFQGQTIVRGFAFYPQLQLLTLAVLFAKPRWNWAAPLILIVNIVAIWLSYTRSWLLVALLVFAAVLLVRLLKARQMHLAVRRLGAVVLLGVVVGAGVMLVLPTQSGYFISRLNATQAPGGLSTEGSFSTRRTFIAATYRHVSDTDGLLGVGFADSSQDARLSAVARWSADTLWVPVVYRLGLVGVGLFIAVFVAYLARALLTALRSSGDVEYLALVWLGVIAGTMMETFVSWSVANPNRFPLGLWAFAFLAALPLVTTAREKGLEVP